MAKKLYLMRHAQSADKQPGQPDIERELTVHGMREALQIGAYLQSENFFCDLFLCSTAIRAKSTMEFVLEALKLPAEKILFNDEIYNASTRVLYEQIVNMDDHVNSVIIVGHNPSITYLTENLTRAEVGDMAPAGLAIIHFNIAKWRDIAEGCGELIRYICPQTI